MSFSKSSSSTATRTSNKDGRVGSDNGAIGVSSEGDVSLNIVADEAFYLGEFAIEAVRDIAENAQNEAGRQTDQITQTFASALATTQENAATESGQIGEQLVKVGLPVALIAFAASQIWGK